LKLKLPSFFQKKKIKALKGFDAKSWSLGAGLIVALLVLVLYFFGMFRGLESRSLDLWMRLRGPLPVHSDIKIIGVDDTSLSAFGRWPWPRSYHAALLDMLAPFKPKVVIYDMIFSEPTEDSPDEDKSFQVSLLNAGNVILGSFFSPLDKSKEEVSPEVQGLSKEVLIQDSLGLTGKRSHAWFQGTGPTFSIPMLHEAAYGSGFVNALPDRDGKIRRIPMVLNYGDLLFPSLAFQGVRTYWGLDKKDIRWQAGKEVELLKDGKTLVRIPVNRKGETFINFSGPFNHFPVFSFAQLMVAHYNTEELWE